MAPWGPDCAAGVAAPGVAAPAGFAPLPFFAFFDLSSPAFAWTASLLPQSYPAVLDYALHARLTSDEAYDTARWCLADTLACMRAEGLVGR